VATIVKRPAALLDIEEHAWFIFRDNEEAGLRFPLAFVVSRHETRP